MQSLRSFDGPVWRILPQSFVDTPAKPARAPEGRFHHSGQIAAYASLSAEGASVAMQRYLGDRVARKLVPMWLKSDRVVDERDNRAASVIWQDIRANALRSPTWVFSDTARDAGAQAMLYSSRSRPELNHVVVFDPACLSFVGPETSFEP
ncbi:MAG: RES family NAD+ phosphorylase [Rhodobacteraceae bacterium]|nr:RES family NAD+ phosphorylase [Paracoccaceae bacterium]